ncbi:uncharacterized protein G2W53_000920 [Senna tora]|uniref:Uncharacterized protein n=1 Tax=Senna tora TaxID=362788 RepID=A0A834XEL0_9FABA|nr:uncharacterized protein G2W53_000920 [Senna tora]
MAGKSLQQWWVMMVADRRHSYGNGGGCDEDPYIATALREKEGRDLF